MENILDRLIFALDKIGLKKHGRATQLAKLTGYSVSMVSDVLRGKAEISDRFLELVSSKLGLSKEWLESGEGEMERSLMPDLKIVQSIGRGSRIAPANFPLTVYQIPVLGRISAGFPNVAVEEVLEYISIPGTPENSFAVVVKGASMEPTFRDSDYVIFIENGEYRNNDVLVVLDEWGEAMVKRLKEKGERKYLISDNPAYPVVEPNENYRIIGKVVKVWRDIKF